MAALLKFQPQQLPTAPAPVDPIRLLPDWARQDAEGCLAIIRPALARVYQGVSNRAASEWLASTSEGMPSARTIQRWVDQYLKGGLVQLAPKYKGRERKEQKWEARALALFNQPQRPAYSTVALWLRLEGFETASEHLVRRYLKAAPSNITETGRRRVGAHYYNQNIKPHVIRDLSGLPVGFVYEGDGHCCDVYVEHPARGHFRPELTVWLDVRSHYPVAWWISESESAHTTLFSLSEALVAHNHVPAFVHTDPGSGFVARVVSHEVTGFLAKFGIEPLLALPGNAKGKGLVEGFFRWFEERCGKQFPSYCGHCRTDDDLSRLSARIKRGEITLPTLQQYIDAIRSYMEFYKNNPQDGLGGKSPAQLWATLEHVTLGVPAEAVIRPRERRTVTRWGVKLDKRIYRASQLAQHETRDVLVEYSLHDDERVWIHDLDGRFVCEAQLVKKAAWLPESRVVEAQQTRLDNQLKREQRAIDEKKARARSMLPHYQDHAALGFSSGHSISPPTAPRPAALTEPQLDERSAALLQELQSKPTPVPRKAVTVRHNSEEEIAQRFERAQMLLEQINAGSEISDSDSSWLGRYQNTAEYRGQLMFNSSFTQLQTNA